MAREEIIKKLKSQIVDQVGLPDLTDGDWIEFEDPIAQFQASVEFVGGACIDCPLSALATRLEEFAEWNAAKRVFSAVEGVEGNVDLEAEPEPHDLENLDFVVYPGEFAVAENGAVWVTDERLKHRVVFFITQFLVLVVKKDQILHNMHEAYQRATVPQPGFGLFLSGPSKTADIEQSLVIGAHGCRELQVILV